MIPPHAYPEQALVAATTHDLPTLKGFWAGQDILIRQEAGVYLRKMDIEQDQRGRAADRKRLWEALHREGLCSAEAMPSSLSVDMIQVLYRYLARTPSRLLIVQLEDLLAEIDTPNLPGAPDSVYPSWRVRIGRDLTAWLKDPAILRFARAMQRERRKGGGTHRMSRETVS